MKDINLIGNDMILAEDQYFDLDCYKTQVNNNVLVVGSPGTGKTRSIVSPNILQALGSYIIVDPKGDLYEKYGDYLREKGYVVHKLNFSNPEDPETCSYNFFHYIRSDQDILKIAHMLIYSTYTVGRARTLDQFWDDIGELLLVSMISFLYYYEPPRNQNLGSILHLIQMCQVQENNSDVRNPLDVMFDKIKDIAPDSFAYRSYLHFRQASGKTLKNILITVSSKLAVFDTPGLQRFFSEDTIDIQEIGNRKTALFVIVSDTDRSMDPMANMFFTQAMNELVRVADAMPDHRLPIDVRFILDDFATNVRIGEFPRLIASIRSRGISTMLMIQAEAQLRNAYGEDAQTIIGSCDTYVYLGGNDVETAKSVSQRANLPLSRILYMPVGTNWIFRRGQQPVNSKNFDFESFAEVKLKEHEQPKSEIDTEQEL